MAIVHIALRNGGVWFITDSKQKLVKRIKREFGDVKSVEVLDEEGDDEFRQLTVDELIEVLYDCGAFGKDVDVYCEKIADRGDDYTSLLFTECEVE